VYAFEVPNILKPYAIVRLVARANGHARDPTWPVCHPFLVELSDRDSLDCVARRLESLVLAEGMGDRPKILDLLAARDPRFAPDEQFRLLSERLDDKEGIAGTIVVLANPAFLGRLDWNALKLKTTTTASPAPARPTLTACIRQFLAAEFVGRNCPECGTGRIARISLETLQLPKCLALHLCRFSSDCRKITSEIECPEVIALAEGAAKDEVRYTLCGACSHAGGILGGHYTATVWSEEHRSWVRCDGESFFREKWRPGSQPYLLFYGRAESPEK
jgi:hypothetical protein